MPTTKASLAIIFALIGTYFISNLKLSAFELVTPPLFLESITPEIDGDTGHPIVTKWVSDLPVIGIVSSDDLKKSSKKFMRGLEKVVLLYNKVDGVELKFRSSGNGTSKSNILVYLGTEEEIKAYAMDLENTFGEAFISPQLNAQTAADQSLCAFWSASDKATGNTFLATIFIEISSDLLTCFSEELLQVLGLSGEFSGEVPSILSNDQTIMAPTKLDLELLGLLYSKEIVGGTTPTRKRLSEIINE